MYLAMLELIGDTMLVKLVGRITGVPGEGNYHAQTCSNRLK